MPTIQDFRNARAELEREFLPDKLARTPWQRHHMADRVGLERSRDRE